MTYKRYQYRSIEGIKWTDWFKWDSDNRDPWQLKSGKLKNEYRENP